MISVETASAVVCIPARNEADQLPRLLRSLSVQRGVGPGSPLRVVVVANDCSDGTAAIARSLKAGSLSVRVIETRLPAAAAHVGTARRMALDMGAAWLREDGVDDGILLMSDADAEVPSDWVAANCAALGGAEIVGGRLVIRHETAPDPRLSVLHARIEAYWTAVRALEDRLDPPPYDPSPRHGDHTGASLALRARTYREVGGLPPLRRGEDNALVARVREAGGRVRHDPDVHVLVSDRILGRAEGGMAAEIARRQAVLSGHGPYLLPAPRHWWDVLQRRSALRHAWLASRRDAERMLLSLGLDPRDVDPATCPNDIAFVERASRAIEARVPASSLVPLEPAIAALGMLVVAGRVAA